MRSTLHLSSPNPSSLTPFTLRSLTLRSLTLHLALLLCLVAAPVDGQDPSGHATGQSDSVKTLTAAEVEGLLTGSGMGLARAAEVNSYPGPLHVLELVDSLALSADQRGATEALFTSMRNEAITVGREVLTAEQALDAAFAAGAPEAELRRLVDRVTERRGELRWVHLRTHLRMRELLTPHQLHLYDRLRGHGGEAGHDHGNHGG